MLLCHYLLACNCIKRGNSYNCLEVVVFTILILRCPLYLLIHDMPILFVYTAPSYNVNTLAGPIVPVMNDDAEKTITVDMGPPILDGPTVPTTLEPNADDNSVVEQTLECNGKEWKVSAVSMGNPHAIIFVDDLEKDIDFEVDGPALESHPAFPAKTNVEFVQVMSPTHLKMKVWERGAGPTLACGTGTCALVVAAIRANKIPRPADGEQVRVTLPGGDLLIEWRAENNKVYMSGPGTFSFKGQAVLK